MTDLIREYLVLGLRFDRLVEGFVDAFTGDPALRADVANEPAPNPADLARHAAALRRDVTSSGLADDRQRWLDGQLHGLAFLIELLALNGRSRLTGDQVFSVLQY